MPPWRTRTPERAKEIILRVCEEEDVYPGDVLSDCRLRRIIYARWKIWAELREVRRADGSHVYSMSQIGHMFGKDHTTVSHGLERVSAEGVA